MIMMKNQINKQIEINKMKTANEKMFCKIIEVKIQKLYEC